MTGPLVPVGILNLIRASLGIPPDSTFPENALAYPVGGKIGVRRLRDDANPAASACDKYNPVSAHRRNLRMVRTGLG